MNNYIPVDTKEMTDRFLKEGGGICGQSCLAVIEKSTIKKVLNDWEKMGLVFKGYSGWKQLRQYLETKGYNVKLKRMNNLGSFFLNNFYILRVQWLGNGEKKDKPFYGWGHWTEASSHTHFIVIHKSMFFCNEEGWSEVKNLENYLTGAVATSVMEVKIG